MKNEDCLKWWKNERMKIADYLTFLKLVQVVLKTR